MSNSDTALARGPIGPRGYKGEKGDKGDKGERGIMGLEGETGPVGPIGPVGPSGPRGIMGLEGKAGKDGKDGKDGKTGPRGPKGEKGDSAEDIDVEPVAQAVVSDHEKKFDHSLIDPFILGTKTVSEKNIADGKFLKYDAKSDKLIYSTIRDFTDSISKQLYLSAGIGIPAQAGNNGKYLTTDGAQLSWGSAAGGGGITRTISSISSPTTAGATALTDYVYFVSSTTTLTLPTAVGNSNRYTIKNSGTNTVTVATTSAQTIDASTTATLTPNTSLDLISDNANWRVV